MEYKFIPDNYKKDEIKNKFKDYNEFLLAFKLYKEGFESYINEIIHADKIDEIINSVITLYPQNDEEYNIYHKYSNLKSKFFYIRNNYYVEKLSKEEIDTLLNGNTNEDFYKNTLERVMFEEYDTTFFGTPIIKNLVNGKSIIFEFCYDATKLKTIDELEKANKLSIQLFEYVKKQMNSKTKFNLSFLVNELPTNELKKEESKTF